MQQFFNENELWQEAIDTANAVLTKLIKYVEEAETLINSIEQEEVKLSENYVNCSNLLLEAKKAVEDGAAQ